MTKLPNVSNIDAVLRGFFEASRDLMTVADADGRLSYVSPAARELLGLEPEECVGRHAWAFVHPDDLEAMREAFRDLVDREGAHSCTFENRQVSSSGAVIWMLWTVTRQEDADGALSCIASCGRDISALKDIEQKLDRNRVHYESVLAGMLDPVVTIDSKGIIQDANRSCAGVFGYLPDELIGKNIKILLPEPFRSEHDGYLERYRQTGRTHILGRTREFPVLRKDGMQIECELSVSRIEIAGQEPLFCGSFRDITDRKLSQHRETAMMRTFADIGESASILAHEIKNPITAVNLALRAVAKHLGEDESAVLSELVERMQKMERLMRRTLSLARPLKLNTSASGAGELLESAVKFLEPHLQETEIEVETSVANGCPMVDVDRDFVEEVLTNLIRNSIEAMQRNGRIRLAAEGAQGGVRISVEDDGPGIPEQIRTTLFKPFVTTKSDGTGVGLAISRKIVEAHGGTIEATDSPLGGARFDLCLPAAGSSNE